MMIGKGDGDPQEERQRMEAIVSRFASGDRIDVPARASESGLFLAQQDFDRVWKPPTGWEGNSASAPMYTPVTEIRTQHYRWTEEKGIEETVSKEEEIAAARAGLRQELENAVTAKKNVLPLAKLEQLRYDGLCPSKRQEECFASGKT